MVDSIPVEEMVRILGERRGMVEKVVRDFFREGRVGELRQTMSMVGLEEVEGEEEEAVEIMEGEGEEGTLGEAVEIMMLIPVKVGEAPITMATTKRMNVVLTRLVMVK